MRKLERAVCLAALAIAAGAVAQPSPEGLWTGLAQTRDETTRLEVQLLPGEAGWRARINLPDIGVQGWPAESVSKIEDTFTVVVRADAGPQTLTLSHAAGALNGSWRDPRYEELARVRLARSEPESAFIETPFDVAGPAGRLGASLILPPGEGPFPGVVFTHGSGPQPRDASRGAAHALARHGIASVIYDKRGVGASEGDFRGATMTELAEDAVAVARRLAAHPDIAEVGFAGHSQGGWVGPLAATRFEPAAFVIVASGPAVPPSRETQWPVIRAMRAVGAGAAEEQAARAIFGAWHRGLRSGDWTTFERLMAQAEAERWFEPSGIAWLRQRPTGDTLRTYTAIMDYDPMPALRERRAPMLWLLAPEDESIDAVETEAILRELDEPGRPIEIVLYPGYDHGMRRLGARWPVPPRDYYDVQARFIHQHAKATLANVQDGY